MPTYKLNVAGCLCTPQDLLVQEAPWQRPVEPGDAIVFFNCGAYGATASPIDFLGHGRPREIMAS